MTTTEAKDIFISYGREDGVNEFVAKLKEELEKDEFSVWMDRADLEPGDQWYEEIAAAVNRCQVFIAVVTKKYEESKYCKEEIGFAHKNNKRIIPIIYEDGVLKDGSGLDMMLRGINWIRKKDKDFLLNLKKGLKVISTGTREEPEGAQESSSHTHSQRNVFKPEDLMKKKADLLHLYMVFEGFERKFDLLGAGLDVDVGDIEYKPAKPRECLKLVFGRCEGKNVVVTWEKIVGICEDFPNDFGKVKSNIQNYLSSEKAHTHYSKKPDN